MHADSERYRLIAWCVMPNHVHVLIKQMEGYPLGDVIQSWKSATAHKINGVVGQEGRLWRREYFDRFMRDSDHLSSTIEYIEENPVKAQLVAHAVEWRFSSARLRSK